MPKIDNTNTPVRPHIIENITLRKKDKNVLNNDLSSSDDESILGDTQITDLHNQKILKKTTKHLPIEDQTKLIFDQIEKILDNKLEKMKQCIIMEIKNIYEAQPIPKLPHKKKDSVESNLTKLTTENISQNHDLLNINKYINELKEENKKLQHKMKEIQIEIKNTQTVRNESSLENLLSNNNKKVVLYGLQKNKWETDDELYDRVLNVFYNILNINLDGQIEEVYRLGKKGNKTPVVVELLSKNGAKYITQNKSYFQNTGLAVSEFLDENSRKERKKMIEILVKAKQNGYRAHIKNNKLFINGTETNLDQQNTSLYCPRETQEQSLKKTEPQPINDSIRPDTFFPQY